MIRVNDLCKSYGSLQVLKNISISVNKGDVIAIIGPSGGGKSTFLRCLNKLEEPTSGDIYIKGVNIMDKKTNINELRSKISMVFQQFNLFANKNVMQNLILAPMLLKVMNKSEAEDKARIILKKVGLLDKELYPPHKLSGGQKQRIAIARSLMMQPDAILFDEPTSALDPEMIGEVLKIIKDLASEGMTMILVTHEMGFAKNVANRIWFMDEGEVSVDKHPNDVFGNFKHERLNSFLNKVLNH